MGRSLSISRDIRNLLKVTILLAGIGVFWGGVLNAADEPVPSVAPTTAVTEGSWVKKNIEGSYFGIYQGPALTRPTSGGSIDSTSLDYTDAEQALASQIRFNYKLTEDAYVGPVINFQVNPFAANKGYMLDSGVRIGSKKLIHTANFNLAADVRVMAIEKPSEISNNALIDLQTLWNFTYVVPKTDLTLGLLCFHYYVPYGSGVKIKDAANPADPRDLNLYFGPNVSYQATKTLALTMFYELYPYHRNGGSWNTFNSDPADIAPGVSWDITPNINVSPQLIIYPKQVAWNTVGTVVYIFATFM